MSSFSSTVRLQLRIDCEVKEKTDTQGKATLMLEKSDNTERTQEVVQGAAEVRVTSNQPQAVVQEAEGVPVTSIQPQALVQEAEGVPVVSIQPQAVVQEVGVPVTSIQPQAVDQEAEGVPVASYQPQAVVQEAEGVPVTSIQPQAVVQGGIPNTQQVLNHIAIRIFETIDLSKPEERNGFLKYMENVRNVLVVDGKLGSLIITVECSSLQSLDELWKDYCTGNLNEVAQKFLVTEDILEAFGPIEVKLIVTIAEEDYRACRDHFLKRAGESYRITHIVKISISVIEFLSFSLVHRLHTGYHQITFLCLIRKLDAMSSFRHEAKALSKSVPKNLLMIPAVENLIKELFHSSLLDMRCLYAPR